MDHLTRDMERVHRIQSHTLFQTLWKNLQEAEENRAFCRHTMEHFLDVARLMYIYALEDGAMLRKDVIYAAALLHDIGRYEQLVSGTPHDLAGAQLAGEIMEDCGFTSEEIQSVQGAISEHRKRDGAPGRKTLSAYLYRADKQSRPCFVCPMREACNWPEETKNIWIEY